MPELKKGKMRDKDMVLSKLANIIPRCPRCGKELKFLLNIQSGRNYYTMDKDGNYELDDTEADGEVNKWCCPYCFVALANNEDDALDILNGKKDPEILNDM